MSGTIFINYRRDDDPGFTQAIYQKLEAEFGANGVKMDVEGGIRGGENYVEKLLALIDQSDVVLSIIGREWHSLLDKTDYDPPNASQDWVRIELKAALDRQKRIIPVVVGKAAIPDREALPEDLKDLSYLQVVSVTNERFKTDTQRLIAEVQHALQRVEDERREALRAERRAAKKARVKETTAPSAQGPEMPWVPQIAGMVGVWLLVLSAVLLMQFALPPADPATEQKISGPDTAFLMSTSLLAAATLFPGVILFYGSLSASRNVQEMARQLMWVITLTGVVWLSYGHSLSFADGGNQNAYVGGLSEAFRAGTNPSSLLAGVPGYVFVFNSMLYALLGTCLITGAFVERIKFHALMLFSALWVTLVFVPVTHWVWGGGFLADMNVLDFAGGLSIATTVGISGLVGLIFIEKKADIEPASILTGNSAMPLLGASFLLLGWLGLIAGSYLSADVKAMTSVYSAIMATATAALAWLLVESTTKGEMSPLGLMWGAMAGLVASLSAAGNVGPMGAALSGLLSGLSCLILTSVIRNRISHDERLNILGILAGGGTIGMIGTGVLTAEAFGGAGLGVDVVTQVLNQIYGLVSVALWSGLVSVIILKTLDIAVGLKPPETTN